MEEIGAKKR